MKKRKKRVRRITGWKRARLVLERWRRSRAHLEVELRTPRNVGGASVDFLQGESLEPSTRAQRVFRARLLDHTSADLVLRRPSGSLLVADLYEIVSLSNGKIRVEPS